MSLKQEILRLLKEDEEFRYTVAGLLGLREVIEELRKLREDFNNFMKLESQRWEENNRRWEENWRRWEENAKQWEEQFRFNRWLANALIEIRDSLGGAYEYYTANWVRIWLEERGFRCEVRVNVNIPVDGFKELDVVCFDPLVIGEATVSIKTIEGADRELRKLLENVEATERFLGRKAYAKILAVENAPDEVADYIRRRCEELGILLIFGRSYG
ncbi:MAG: hypothetical protein NZ992_02455 [Candidatus Korarchaeum sp.]|nr:hypothetical protein [Candidatus Korarchaeum sp.]MDW8036309.1 hypothetical protein [Candidatus Korarchaeum sp.]